MLSLARASPVVYNYAIQVDGVCRILDRETKMKYLGVQIEEQL